MLWPKRGTCHRHLLVSLECAVTVATTKCIRQQNELEYYVTPCFSIQQFPLTFHPSCFNCLAVRVTLPPSSTCDVFSICISVIDNTYCSQSDPERGFVTQLMQFSHNEMADTNNRINWLSIRQPEGVACPSDWLAPLNYLENKKSVNYAYSLSVWIDYENWIIAQVKISIESNIWSWSIICQDIFCWICDRFLHRGKEHQ
jgi:hypothetical protein